MKERIFPRAKGLATRITVSPLRIVAYILHATGLERIYKPRFVRHSALLDLTDEIVGRLPKYCYTITGAQSDPINLVFVAHERDLRRAFKVSGWHRANPASPLHALYGLYTALRKRPYKTGPFAPLYVNIALQDLAYQRSNKRQSYRERHHLRVWRTGITLSDGKRVWVSAAGRENGMRLAFAMPFYTHALDPNIDAEREYIVSTLTKVGAVRLKSVAMTEPIMASDPHKTVFGSEYYTDGRAVVVEV